VFYLKIICLVEVFVDFILCYFLNFLGYERKESGSKKNQKRSQRVKTFLLEKDFNSLAE
jgi:hypothetical protein